MRLFWAVLGCSLSCTGASACTGDLNDDHLINQQDLGILLADYGIGSGGDVDGDGDTDQSDLGALLAVYDTQCPAPEGMVLITGGEFAMGDHTGNGNSDERPVHDVYINSFYMDIYEVTNQQYAAYLNDALIQNLIEVTDGVVYRAGGDEVYCDTETANNLSRIYWDGNTFTVVPGTENHPMELVSWYGAAAYCNWRSSVAGLEPAYDTGTWVCNFAADGYRLPTEAEWEYAARGGEYSTYYIYPWGDTIEGSQANYWQSGDEYDNYSPATTPIGYYDGGQTPPGVDMANGYGLYDMAGNVFDWCNDWYYTFYYTNSPYDNPQGPESGNGHVLRGGSWSHQPNFLRSAYRYWSAAWNRSGYFGFRTVLD